LCHYLKNLLTQTEERPIHPPTERSRPSPHLAPITVELCNKYKGSGAKSCFQCLMIVPPIGASNETWTQCDKCTSWFHNSCVGIKRKLAQSDQYCCSYCKWKPMFFWLVDYLFARCSFDLWFTQWSKIALCTWTKLVRSRLFDMNEHNFVLLLCHEKLAHKMNAVSIFLNKVQTRSYKNNQRPEKAVEFHIWKRRFQFYKYRIELFTCRRVDRWDFRIRLVAAHMVAQRASDVTVGVKTERIKWIVSSPL
jgi:hypothetical protein